MLAACDLVRYYVTVGRENTLNYLRSEPVIKNFAEQWKALTNRKMGDDPEVPKISKTLSVIKWMEAFTDFLHCHIGIRMILLAYVTREEVLVPAA